MQAEQTAHRVLFLIRNVGSPAHLPRKLLQHHRQLPELYHDRIPAFQESVLPFQIHGGTSEIPVQLCEILFLVPARLQKQPGHVLIFHSALLLKGTQQIIQILLTCGRIGIVHLLKHLIHIQIAPGNFINRKFSGMFIRITTDMRKPLRSVFPFQLLTIIRVQALPEPFLFLTVIV